MIGPVVELRLILAVYLILTAGGLVAGAQDLERSFSTFLGTTFQDQVQGVGRGPGGVVYVTGVTTDGEFLSGLADPVIGARSEELQTFVVRLDAKGERVEALALIRGFEAKRMTIGPQGDPYIAGFANPTRMPPAVGIRRHSHPTWAPGVIHLTDDLGHIHFAALAGGWGSGWTDWIGGVAVDGEGNTYLAGMTGAADFPTTPDAFQTVFRGEGGTFTSMPANGFVVKFAPDGGSIVYATYLGGDVRDGIEAVGVDGEGHAYVAGPIGSTWFPWTFLAFRPLYYYFVNYPGSSFVAKLTPDGSRLVYSAILPWMLVKDLAVQDGRAVVGGYGSNIRFPMRKPRDVRVGRPLDQLPWGSVNGRLGFVARLSADGSDLEWTHPLRCAAETGGMYVHRVAVDRKGMIHAAATGECRQMAITPGPVEESAPVNVAEPMTRGVLVRLDRDGLLRSQVTVPVQGVTGLAVGGWLDDGVSVVGSATQWSAPADGALIAKRGTQGEWDSQQPPYLISYKYSPYAVEGRHVRINTALPEDERGGMLDLHGPEGEPFEVELNDARLVSRPAEGRLPARVRIELRPGSSGQSVSWSPIVHQVWMGAGREAHEFEVTLRHDPKPPVLERIENFASKREGWVAPGTIVSLLGRDFGLPREGIAVVSPQGGYPISLEPSNVRVDFAEVTANLLYGSDTELRVIVPPALRNRGWVPVRIRSNDGESREMFVEMAPADLGVFTVTGSGRGRAVATNEDGTANSPGNPARPGEVISVFATGLYRYPHNDVTYPVGGREPMWLWAGAAIAGRQAEVVYSGTVAGESRGLLEVQIRVPGDLAPGEHPLLVCGGYCYQNRMVSSQPGVTVSVR